MPSSLRHFAINADDFARARGFYETVFGWTFKPWGPPDFLQTWDAGETLVAALQGRRDISGRRMPDFELSFAVDDIEKTAAAVRAAGGEIVMAPYEIEGVGKLIFFADTEGNIAGAMEYVEPAEPPRHRPFDAHGLLRHFAINAEDTARARAFYEAVFGWTFTPWGPPGFYQVLDAGVGLRGALQGRRDMDGRRMPGFEPSFGVADLARTLDAIKAAGGEVLTPVFEIPTVGRLAFFADTEGNPAGAMQYEAVQWPQ